MNDLRVSQVLPICEGGVVLSQLQFHTSFWLLLSSGRKYKLLHAIISFFLFICHGVRCKARGAALRPAQDFLLKQYAYLSPSTRSSIRAYIRKLSPFYRQTYVLSH